MSAMTNFTMRSLRANRVRTFVTIAGVALAAALLSAILISYTSLADFLYRSEAASTGTWMSYAQADDSPEFERQIDNAKNDSAVTSMATFADKGFGELTAEQQNMMGRYLPIVAAEGDLASLAAISPSEGRMPENDHELLLWSGWKSGGNIQIGDTLNLNVGQRQAVGAPGSEVSGDVLDLESGRSHAYSIEVGSMLNTSIGYLDSEQDNGYLDEKLVNTQQESYTVVGFYERSNYAASSSVGPLALTRGNPGSGDFTRVYLDFSSVTTSDEVVERTEALFPDADIELHTALLRFMGVSSDANIWQTFFNLVAILIVIISLACISLIFNAFNISVAERMNAFALLSSVGATPAQLRRSVLLEGLFVAIVGIPLGILIGLAGCAITFQLLGPAIAQVASNGIVPFELKVDGWALLVALGLTLITVLVSSWVPSLRASRVNTIDALRQTSSSRISKRGAREAGKAVYSSLLWKKRGLAGRVFGIGGTLSRINRRRSATKGRAAAFSLAVAIVLFMTAGSLNAFLGTLVDAATQGSQAVGEVSVSGQFSGSKTEQEQVSPDSAHDYLAQKNVSFRAQVDEFQEFYAALSEAPNAEPLEWLLTDRVIVTVPNSMAGEAFEKDVMQGGRSSKDAYATAATITFLDDATFDRYAQKAGLDPALYHDSEHPRAIALSQTYGNDGEKYLLMNVLSEPGTIEVMAASLSDDEPVADLGFEMDDESESGFINFAPYVLGEHDGLDRGSSDSHALDIARVPLEVAALTNQAPANCGVPDGSISLIVPMSLARIQGFGASAPLFYSYFDSTDGDHATLAAELNEKGITFMDDTSYQASFVSYNDFVEERNSVQMLATIVNVFCLLFTVILALIAMANVFNTVTNSLILRKREFAVMRSIGLSPKQFRRMIIDECVHFGIAGLVPGLIVSFGVSLLLYGAVAQSIAGMSFAIPWGYLALAILMTIAIMALSVAYGLHRCKSNSVVDALRSSNI